ncbi:MAG: hypothetical protein IT462_11450 [Planctomycetes bacterium]|nr:hypothetical protein [Planctomycetota bacterium]
MGLTKSIAGALTVYARLAFVACLMLVTCSCANGKDDRLRGNTMTLAGGDGCVRLSLIGKPLNLVEQAYGKGQIVTSFSAAEPNPKWEESKRLEFLSTTPLQVLRFSYFECVINLKNQIMDVWLIKDASNAEFWQGSGDHEMIFRKGHSIDYWVHWQDTCLVIEFCEVLDDKRHGLYIAWHSNRSMASMGYYTNGEKSGTWLEFNEDSVPIRMQSYKNGKVHKSE